MTARSRALAELPDDEVLSITAANLRAFEQALQGSPNSTKAAAPSTFVELVGAVTGLRDTITAALPGLSSAEVSSLYGFVTEPVRLLSGELARRRTEEKAAEARQ